MIKRIWFTLLIAFFSILHSQELPPIERFTPQDYSADDQNWSVSQDTEKNIYVANNRGLLQYNGARWNLYKAPNQAIVRSVSVIDDLIYTGSYMDFGFWKRDSYGKLNYSSITNYLKQDLLEDEEFWNIIALDDYVLFQSLDRIYIYDTKSKSFKIIESEFGITKSFKVSNTIYFQEKGTGISKIENGKAISVTGNTIIKNNEIVNILDDENGLLIHTRNNGFFKLVDGRLSRWDISANDLLSEISVYNSIRLIDGSFVLGTISNGVVKLSASGDVEFQMSRNVGLSNNTVLSLFEDITGNIWLGLDNGINVLNLNSPYRVFTDGQGYLGTIYASEKTDKHLYLGTNQGLFFRPINSDLNFKLVPNTKGQVWSLKQISNTLFCGHDKGSFIIKDGKATPISLNNGTWKIKSFTDHSDLLIQGNYDGLAVVSKDFNSDWKFRNKIKGFNMSSRYFEFISKNEVLVSHEYKGVFKLKINDDFTEVVEIEKLNIGKSIGASLVNYRGNFYYAYNQGVFQYDKKTKKFNKSNLLKGFFTQDNYVSGKLIVDNNNDRLWAFFKNQIVYVEPGMLSDKPIVTVIDLPSGLRNSKLGFENILFFYDSNYLLGTTNGYLTIDLNKFKEKSYKVKINDVMHSTLHQQKKLVDISKKAVLKNKENDISFNFSVSDFVKLSSSMYQYRLDGIYNSWSNWSPESSVLFENLPHGNYTFQVRAKVSNHLSVNTASYKFTIEKPWFLKPLAFVVYAIAFLFVMLAVQYFNNQYYKRQKKSLLASKQKELEIMELENKQQLMEFRNKSLQQDVDNKSRELGLSTMTLIRKNEFLGQLKKELNALDTTKELSKIIKIIDKNINNTEDWKFFEEAFNNADKEFLKKIKKKHASLTPNDLKLCAYLRLNLSSKEIAPLLNISHRSVEVKRYRLRKKMQLPHEASLTNYILEI